MLIPTFHIDFDQMRTYIYISETQGFPNYIEIPVVLVFSINLKYFKKIRLSMKLGSYTIVKTIHITLLMHLGLGR